MVLSSTSVTLSYLAFISYGLSDLKERVYRWITCEAEPQHIKEGQDGTCDEFEEYMLHKHSLHLFRTIYTLKLGLG
jgi:hypothetical protein